MWANKSSRFHTRVVSVATGAAVAQRLATLANTLAAHPKCAAVGYAELSWAWWTKNWYNLPVGDRGWHKY